MYKRAHEGAATIDRITRSISFRKRSKRSLALGVISVAALPFVHNGHAVALHGAMFGFYDHHALLTEVQGSDTTIAVNDASAPVGQAADLDISVEQSESSESAFLMFQNMPDDFSFSSGFRVKTSWMVSLRDLESLQLVPPDGYEGEVELRVLLVKGRDEAVEGRDIRVRFGEEPQIAAAPEPPVEQAEPEPSNDQVLTSSVETTANAPDGIGEAPDEAASLGISVPSELQISPDQERKLFQRAAGLLEVGQVASARLMFQHLAKQGSGIGALAMAKTFDPIFFQSIQAVGGLSADLEQARLWYAVAARLGQQEARDRLDAIIAAN